MATGTAIAFGCRRVATRASVAVALPFLPSSTAIEKIDVLRNGRLVAARGRSQPLRRFKQIAALQS